MFGVIDSCVEQVFMPMILEACVITCDPPSSYKISMFLLLKYAQILSLSENVCFCITILLCSK